MLSGVGPADHLREHGIDVTADNPHVGAHFHDHPVTFLVWRSTRPGSLYEAEKPASLLTYVTRRKGLLTSNVGEAGGFVRTRPDLPAADIQYHFAPGYFVDHGFETYDGDAFTLGPTLLTPHSRGTVRLRSASPEAHPEIVGNFLDHPEDIAALVAGIRQGRDIVTTSAFADTLGEEIYPGPALQSDAELERYLRQTVELLYHPVGTCRMGAESDSVVDPHLRVYGVEGLRVVDASVMPVVVGGNTNAPTIMIAERAADLILAA
jgi:choline dehydrogenase